MCSFCGQISFKCTTENWYIMWTSYYWRFLPIFRINDSRLVCSLITWQHLAFNYIRCACTRYTYIYFRGFGLPTSLSLHLRLPIYLSIYLFIYICIFAYTIYAILSMCIWINEQDVRVVCAFIWRRFYLWHYLSILNHGELDKWFIAFTINCSNITSSFLLEDSSYQHAEPYRVKIMRFSQLKVVGYGSKRTDK